MFSFGDSMPISQRIVSFDVGIKNLSLCISDIKSKVEIAHWTNISLSGKNIAEYSRSLVEKMRIEQFGLIDFVLIEQQLNRNTQMKVLSHVIQTFFMTEHKIPSERIIFVSPKRRFSTCDPHFKVLVDACKFSLNIHAERMSRREFKNLSVEITNKLLEYNTRWSEFFKSHSKKDDLADCFLQLVAWNIDRTFVIDDI